MCLTQHTHRLSQYFRQLLSGKFVESKQSTLVFDSISATTLKVHFVSPTNQRVVLVIENFCVSSSLILSSMQPHETGRAAASVHRCNRHRDGRQRRRRARRCRHAAARTAQTGVIERVSVFLFRKFLVLSHVFCVVFLFCFQTCERLLLHSLMGQTDRQQQQSTTTRKRIDASNSNDDDGDDNDDDVVVEVSNSGDDDDDDGENDDDLAWMFVVGDKFHAPKLRYACKEVIVLLCKSNCFVVLSLTNASPIRLMCRRFSRRMQNNASRRSPI
jgi:hypothetical protein